MIIPQSIASANNNEKQDLNRTAGNPIWLSPPPCVFNWATENSSSGSFSCEPAFWGQISSDVQFCPRNFF